MMQGKKCTRLSILSFAIALGVANGLCMMILALSGMFWNYGLVMIQELSLLFQGFAATWAGSFYGLGWGFLEGFLFGLIMAIVYNLCLCCCSSKEK
jgi:hypothetical protein